MGSNAMSRFEYIFVLISIVAGLALTHLLSGLTRSLKSSEQKYDFAHIVFSLATIVLLFGVWWTTFRWESNEVWTFLEFSLLGLFASMFYVMAAILYPSYSPEVPRFDEVRTRFYVALALYNLLEMQNVYMRDGFFAPFYVPMIIHLIVLAGIGLLLRNKRFDQLYAAWTLLVNVCWPFLARSMG
jgi:hypothetical protein